MLYNFENVGILYWGTAKHALDDMYDFYISVSKGVKGQNFTEIEKGFEALFIMSSIICIAFVTFILW